MKFFRLRVGKRDGSWVLSGPGLGVEGVAFASWSEAFANADRIVSFWKVDPR